MGNAQALILGAALVGGLALHGLLGRPCPPPPVPVPIQPAGEATATADPRVMALIEKGGPSKIAIGDKELLVWTLWEIKNGNTSISRSIHELRDGKFVRFEIDTDD